MSFTLRAKKVHCPNCHYEGKAKIEGSGCGLWLVWLALAVITFFFLPLALVAVPMFFWLVFKPAKQVCPKCGFQHPIPK